MLLQKQRKFVIQCAFVVVCFLQTPFLYAKESYVIGMEDIQFLPYFETVDGDFQGFIRELFDAFAKHNNVSIEYVPLPVKRLYRNFYAGLLDAKFPDNANWGNKLRKDHTIHYSLSIIKTTDGLFKSANAGNLSVADIKSVTSILGFYPNLGFEDKIKDDTIKFVHARSAQSALNLVIEGRVDVAFLNVDVANHQLKLMNKDGSLTFATELPHITSGYHLSSIKYPQLIADFDKFLQQQQSTIDDLAKKYSVSWDKPNQ